MSLGERASTLAYRAGWLAVRLIPEPMARWIFTQIADYLWRRQGKSVRQLAANLRRVRPDASEAELRQLTRAGMRSYLRYWVEAFRLPTMPIERITSGMTAVGEEQTALTH